MSCQQKLTTASICNYLFMCIPVAVVTGLQHYFSGNEKLTLGVTIKYVKQLFDFKHEEL
jgi:hypothetical protein